MVAKNIRTQLNYKDRIKDSDIVEIQENKLSKTESCASITPREIMYKYTSGNLPEVQHDSDEPLEKITFEDYLHCHDLDYDLADATRDRILILEKKHEIQKALEIKTKERQDKRAAEKKEFEEFLKAKQEAEQHKQKSEQKKNEPIN